MIIGVEADTWILKLLNATMLANLARFRSHCGFIIDDLFDTQQLSPECPMSPRALCNYQSRKDWSCKPKHREPMDLQSRPLEMVAVIKILLSLHFGAPDFLSTRSIYCLKPQKARMDFASVRASDQSTELFS